MNTVALKSGNLLGILTLIISVSCFGAVDGLSKMVVDRLSFGQIMLGRYALALPVILLVAPPSQWRHVFDTSRPGLHIVRGLMPVVIGGAMVLAVKYLPLAEATVIMFAGPFAVVALSGWLLGERIAASSWIGVAIGFMAVLIVARPGFDALSLYAIFPAIAALFYAVFQIMSRQLGAAGERAGTMLAWTIVVGTVVSLPLAIFDWVPPTPTEWLVLAGLGASMGGGHYFVAKAYVLAQANVLAPFSYFQILSAVAFGLLVFGDVPDIWTICGIVMILAAGVYVFSQNKA